MDDILDRIISDDGHCGSWAKPSVCAICPISKLRQRKDGSFLSCIETLGVQGMTEEAADAIYKEVAIRLKLNKIVDDLLIEDNSSGNK
jgi:hypothetical protein